MKPTFKTSRAGLPLAMVAALSWFAFFGGGGIAVSAEPKDSTAEAPAGFRTLFDGQSLNGWHSAPRLGVPKTASQGLQPAQLVAKGKIATAQELARGCWEVRDGVILGGQDAQRVIHRENNEEWGLGSWLMSDETFGDFELRVDARPDWPCDTGIYVRTTPLGQGF